MDKAMNIITGTKKVRQSVSSVSNQKVSNDLIAKSIEACKPIISRSIKSLYFRKKYFFYNKKLQKSNRQTNDSIILRSAHTDAVAMANILKIQPHKSDLYNNRIKDKNLQCLATFTQKHQLIGWCWFASEKYYESKMDFTFGLNPTQLYQFDGFVLPEFRRQNLGSLSLYAMWDFLIDKGYTHTSAVIDSSNTPALRLHEHVGLRYEGQKIITHYIFKKPFSFYHDSKAP